MDSDSLGLGLQFRLTPHKRWELNTSYNALIGHNTASQQASLTSVYWF